MKDAENELYLPAANTVDLILFRSGHVGDAGVGCAKVNADHQLVQLGTLCSRHGDTVVLNYG